MSTFVAAYRRPLRPNPDIPPPGIFRPSGDLYERPIDFAPENLSEALGSIDVTLAETQASLRAVGEQHLGQAACVGSVRLASEVAPAALEVARQRNAQVLGRAAVYLAGGGEAAISAPKDSLSGLFKKAHEKDAKALGALDVDAAADLGEMVCKSGTEMVAEAAFVEGKLTQFGRSTEERQFNTNIIFANEQTGLAEMSEAEGQNAFMVEALYAEGKLKKGDKLVEFSLVPDKSHDALKGSGLFLREVVAIIRVTEVDQGKVIIKSYLLGGTDQSKLPSITEAKTKRDEEDIEMKALQNRFDIKAVRALLRGLGVKGADKMSPAEILANPVYISGKDGRSLDGIDLSMAYDAAVEDVTGTPAMMGSSDLHKQTAKGQTLTRADYEAHFAKMHEMQRDLKSIGHKVARQCAAAWKQVEGDDYAAGRLMHKFAEQEAVRYLARFLAEENANVGAPTVAARPDMTVMGLRTYQELMNYQMLLMQNNLQGAAMALNRAEQHAAGTGCPSGAKKITDDYSKISPDFSGNGNKPKEPEDPSDEKGSMTFTCPNPVCGKKNTREYNVLRDDCQHCHKKIPRC